MQNIDVAHRFFYDLEGDFDRRSMTVSYSHRKYYSYSTVIGEITETITGKTICIISDNNFSSTTAKHIGELRAACPFEYIYLPQSMGAGSFYPADVVDRLCKNLDYYAEAKLSQAHNREGFIHNFEMLQNTLELKNFDNQFEKATQSLDKYRELFNALHNDEKIKELKAKQREKDKEKIAKAKAQLKEFKEKYSYLDLITFVYSSRYDITKDMSWNEERELKEKIRKALNPKNNLAFIWFEGSNCHTSKHITVNRADVETLLRLWKHNKLKHGMTISHYTVLSVTPEFVKVGCHTIPTENLQALYDLTEALKTLEPKKAIA